jgi:hypothetical protein
MFDICERMASHRMVCECMELNDRDIGIPTDVLVIDITQVPGS